MNAGYGFEFCPDCGSRKSTLRPCSLCASDEGPAEREALADHRRYVQAERDATQCPVCLTVKEIGELCPQACSSIRPAATKAAHRCAACGGSGQARRPLGDFDPIDICDACAGSGKAA